MLRLFQQHQIRKVTELDGMWDFCMDGFSRCYRLPVPGCFEQHPDFLNYRGTGSYTRQLYLDKECNLRLEFKGVSHTADVYFDGEKIARHYNAFTPFSAVVRNAKQGAHTLQVNVDNTFSEASALHVPNDYYTYGGITRPVAMEELSDVYIKYIHFTPYKTDNIWHADIEIRLCNLSDTAKSAEINLELLPDTASHASSREIKGTPDSDNAGLSENAGKPAAAKQTGKATVPASLTPTEKTAIPVSPSVTEKALVSASSEATLTFTREFPDVLSWSHLNPALYYCRAVLSVDGTAVDDLIERVGFRQVRASGRQLLINEEPVFLMGFNRHEDYATVGCAIPLQLMVQDMNLMEAAGANAVRTCHYPNDERFLDLCDERGMLVWEENHARGFTLERMKNPNFDRQCEDCNREMIENHYNHPSIVIWGILNECASETEIGREKYARQYAQIASLDASRPRTSATCRHLKDICLDLPDIVSFNMYSGWYQDVPVDETNRREIEWINASGGAEKPIIVSELGAAAIYGYRDRSRCKWSEEGQSDIIRENLKVYMADPDITGVFIWQFADCRVTEEEWFAARARCHNNKGVVDEYRRPKIAYDTVSEMFHGCKR